jgi:hypothetical protein
MTVTSIDGTRFDTDLYLHKQAIIRLTEAIETLLCHINTSLLESIQAKKEIKWAEILIQDFLNRTRITANLLTGNYETWLKLVAPIFFVENINLKDSYFQCILVALLARLKFQQTRNLDNRRTNIQESKLNDLVLHYIARKGESPADALSILYGYSRPSIQPVDAGNDVKFTLAA